MLNVVNEKSGFQLLKRRASCKASPFLATCLLYFPLLSTTLHSPKPLIQSSEANLYYKATSSDMEKIISFQVHSSLGLLADVKQVLALH